MKIAFDVNGTLTGNNGENVTKFMRWCVRQGHTVYIWSNCISSAMGASKQLNFQNVCLKYSLKDAIDDGMIIFDYAVDDDSYSYDHLAANKFIDSYDVPSDEKLFEDLLKA